MEGTREEMIAKRRKHLRDGERVRITIERREKKKEEKRRRKEVEKMKNGEREERNNQQVSLVWQTDLGALSAVPYPLFGQVQGLNLLTCSSVNGGHPPASSE